VTSAAVIGLDLDNTLVTYDSLFHLLAIELELIAADIPKHKRQIRDAVRRHANGEHHWRVLQGLAYGARMHEAALSAGAEDFLLECHRRRLPVHIVSHRTQHAASDPQGLDLRDAALAWMHQRRFFDADGLGLEPAHVWFEPTRADKVARIRRLGCTHFVDDLEEVFREAEFPPHVIKILYAPDLGDGPADIDGVRVATNWAAVREAMFADR
jgi:hypothetical protein